MAPVLDVVFCQIKQMICKMTLLTYTDWKGPFDIHTNASDYQLGAVIPKENKYIDISAEN